MLGVTIRLRTDGTHCLAYPSSAVMEPRRFGPALKWSFSAATLTEPVRIPARVTIPAAILGRLYQPLDSKAALLIPWFGPAKKSSFGLEPALRCSTTANATTPPPTRGLS